MESIKPFYETLFDSEEQVCWGTNCYETCVAPLWQWNADIESFCFFSINPLKDSRRDSNVTRFRNILLEFDNLSKEAQLAVLSDIPYSTLVWSGSKSYHAIISLQAPCTNRKEYDALVRRIYKKVPQADKSAKNPSRFSRAPGAIRENGNKQELIEVRQRVSKSELEAWLGPENTQELPQNVTTICKDRKRILMPTTNYFLHFGAEDGFWNVCMFNAACDMVRAGWNKEEITKRMKEITGFLDGKDKRTIQSAWDTVLRNQGE